jgi:hypothetical protein
MAKRSPHAILAVWMSLLCHAVASQQPVAPSIQDPRQLAEAAIARYEASEDSKTRFTNFNLQHTLNFDEKGKKMYEALALYEETWINDLPYQRLVELGGKPLKGKKLREEQERYDEAVANRKPLGDEERIPLLNSTPYATDSRPDKAIEPRYSLHELRQENSPHGLLHVIEATSPPSPFDRCRWRYRLWISDQTPTLFQYRADVDDQTHASDMCKGAFDEASWDLVDGIPKMIHFRSHSFVLVGRTRLTVDGENTFNRYRRFSTQVTIGPAAAILEDSTPPR